MSQILSQVESRLAEMGRELSNAPTPAADYLPWRIGEGVIFIAGQIPMANGKVVRTGHVGDDVTLEEAQELAGLCAANCLAQLRNAVRSVGKSLDDVRLLKVGVFVAAAKGFWDIHLVANGASKVFAKACGEPGLHARSAVGVHELPLGVPVEVELTAEFIA